MWLRTRKEARESAEVAKEALEGATERLQKTQSREPEVKAFAKASKLLREHNHFAEQLEIIMMGGNK